MICRALLQRMQRNLVLIYVGGYDSLRVGFSQSKYAKTSAVCTENDLEESILHVFNCCFVFLHNFSFFPLANNSNLFTLEV